jgi:beta-glucosidase
MTEGGVSATVEERVEDLLERMTLDEKIAQVGGLAVQDVLEGDAFSQEKAGDRLAHGIGQITRIAGSTLLRPRETARIANEVQRFLRESTRLGIPAIVHEESLAGYVARDATCFPQAIGLAATWEPALVEEMAGVIRRQMRAVGATLSLSPVLDVARDPRWGRLEETYGEDPYLIGRMGVAYIRGLQGEDLTTGVAATAKHFVGYGAAEGGLNWAPAHIPRRELLEFYVLPFREAIREAGVECVMNAYHEMDGVPCGASVEIMDHLLRRELGFKGPVVSDYLTVPMLRHYHRVAATKGEAARLALEAGIDVELPGLNYYGEPLREAIDSGQTPVALLDQAVRRVLRQKFEMGLFEQPFVDEAAVESAYGRPEDRALARRIARKSFVLLKNDGVLPLDRSLRSIAVIGPAAHSRRLLQGDYHYPTHLEMLYGSIDEQADAHPAGLAECFPLMATVLEAIRGRAPDASVVHAKGCSVTGNDTEGIAEAVAAVRGADLSVLVVGGRSGLVDGCTSGEASDRSDLGLPGVQQRLADAMLDTGKPVVVVFVGPPMSVPSIVDRASAVLQAWMPGEEGGYAIADVLFGVENPGGKMPVTVVRGVGQVPLFYNHKPSGGRSQWRTNYSDSEVAPLFPFGHGLSYTTFEYGPLSIEPENASSGDPIRVRLQVTNSGEQAGDEVVQLYIHDVVASVTRPVLQLAGFVRVNLEPGESNDLEFSIQPEQLAFYDLHMDYVVEPGEFEVAVGSSSEDIRSRGKFDVVGEALVLRTVQ